jgi:acetolactate synthase-1/2/3 large subunit
MKPYARGLIDPPRMSSIREIAPRAALQQAASSEAAKRIVATLVQAGSDVFFGIPGGPVAPIFDAILRTSGARLVRSRHESAAAFEAAGYHRATGRVPVVVVTSGPGATNVLTGVASAHLERIPMVLLCGDVAWATGGRLLLQDCGPEGLDVEHMFSKITRATIRVASGRSASTQALAALDAAADPVRPGPALLVVPIQCGTDRVAAVRTERGAVSHRIAPSRTVVTEVCKMFAEARRPLLVIGAGCRPHAAALRRLLDACNIPFVTTPRAKGLISERHPRSLRHGGLAASHWARRYTALGVDFALVLGTDLDDCSVGPTPYVAQGGRLVHVDIDPSKFHRNLPADIGVVADLGSFIEVMSHVVRTEGYRNGRETALVREARLGSPFENAGFENDDAPVLRPDRAIADLECAAGRGARFVTDIGEHMLFALHYLTADGPDAFMIQLGLGSMGSGICSAIGLALGDPSRRVICICGDGGMQMAGMEALVAVHERLPVVFAVFNDGRYNMVHHGYRAVFGRVASWDAPWVNFVLWARSMGMAGLRIGHPGELSAQKLDRLMADGGPVVLDLRIDPDVRLRGAGRIESLQQMSANGFASEASS